MYGDKTLGYGRLGPSSSWARWKVRKKYDDSNRKENDDSNRKENDDSNRKNEGEEGKENSN